MAFAQTLRPVLAALFFAGAMLPARALQLGETKEQILARHGEAGAEDRGKGVAIYFWTGWSAELEFKEDTVQKLVYRRDAYLEAAEVASLLQSNGGVARWREITQTGEQTRQWVRDDGATASCLAVRPLMMTFQSRQARAALAAAPRVSPKLQNLVPAPAPAMSPKPPSFPKLLGSEPAPEVEPAAEPSAPALPSATLRPLPRLQAEELATEPPTLPTLAPAAAPAEVSAPSSEEAAPSPESASSQGGLGFVFGWLAVVAAVIGGGVYFWKRHSARPEGTETKRRPASPPRTAKEIPRVGTPALDALRSDQFDLLVGEIFRREGYTVELSAAAAQGGTIDLTLRRDSETILVECKHWKAALVTDREVREFHSAMMANGSPRGIFVTAGNFTREAQEFAEGKQIDLMDRAALEESTAAVTRPGENFCQITEWVGEFSAHARVFDPECPICQGSMVIRHNRTTGAASWSCRNHPRCPGRREPRLDLLAAA